MLVAFFERLFAGVESPGPTASSLRRVGLPLAQVPHRSLTAPKAFSVVSQQPSKGVHMGHTSPSQLGSSTTKRRPRWIGRLLPLVFSLLATPAYSASNTDVQWIARWLDDGTGTGIPAEQAEVQAASPKRCYAAGDACTLLDGNNTTGTFGPYSAGNDCVLGEGPGRGQDADWDNILRLNIRTNNSACNQNATLTFKVGALAQ